MRVDRSPRKKRRRTRVREQRPATRAKAELAATPDPFRHVVLLMLENRSFDHMLGAYSQPSLFRRIEQAGRSLRIYHGDFPLALLLADPSAILRAPQVLAVGDVLRGCGRLRGS